MAKDRRRKQADEPGWVRGPLVAAAAVLIAIPHVVVWDYGGLTAASRSTTLAGLAATALLALPCLVWRWRRTTACASETDAAPAPAKESAQPTTVAGENGRQAVFWSPTWLLPTVILIAWGWAGFQTLPLPAFAARWLSPGSAAAYQDRLPEIGITADQWFPISVSPWATRQAWFLPLALGLSVGLGQVVFRRRRQVVWLLVAAMAVGTVFSFLALVDKVQVPPPGPDGRPAVAGWITPDVGRGQPFGTFINRNNAALYINLGLACTVGLLMMSILANRQAASGDEAYELPPENLWDAVRSTLDRTLLQADAKTMALFLIAVLQSAAVLASGSRGGFLAAIAGLSMAILSRPRQGQMLWGAVPVAAASIGVVLLMDHLQLSETARARIESIFTLEEGSQVGRLEHWGDGLAALVGYLPGGSGLATYGTAYLPYQTAPQVGQVWFKNADNQFLEWAVEGGLVAISLLAIGVGLFVRALHRLRQTTGADHIDALSAVGWYLVGCLAVSQFFDFGILAPANLLLVGCLVGAILAAYGQTQRRRRRSRGAAEDMPAAEEVSAAEEASAAETSPIAKTAADAAATELPSPAAGGRRLPPLCPRFIRPRWVGLALAAGWLGAFAATWPVIDQAVSTERQLAQLHRLRAAMDDRPSEHTLQRFEQFLQPLAQTPPQTLDPVLAVEVAQGLLHLQRRAAEAQMPSGLTPPQQRQYATAAGIEFRRLVYYERAAQWSADNSAWPPIAAEPLTAALLPGQQLSPLQQARRLASEGLLARPLDHQARWVLLATDFLDHADFSGEAPLPPTHAQRSAALAAQIHQLWPFQEAVLERAGRLAAAYPGLSAAAPLLSAALTARQPQRFSVLWPLIRTAADDETTALAALPDDPAVLLVAWDSGGLSPRGQQQLASRLTALVEQQAEVWPESRRLLLQGQIAQRQGDAARAAALLGEAAQLLPGDLDVRLQLARALEAAGDRHQALEQIERGLIQSPDDSRFRQHRDRLTQQAQARSN